LVIINRPSLNLINALRGLTPRGASMITVIG